MIDELESIIRSREALFREHSIDSMAQYRRLRAERQTSVAADRFGDVFLVVDGWAGMCRRFPAWKQRLWPLLHKACRSGCTW
ncbi:ESX-1 secretion system EccCb1 domain protein [Mycobacterium xenopi 4042]|uniref:ESX-1 secretion system EccCb1 domain protein n=1 Tax=Mycobacterium xenopi 4042 TaxID=1299334 RepID=X7YJL5_MYCXE|nr:ESX-1 secretion system EccCb1 domain protein [Mycobacterium xenopi 4042]